jgi:hypothetical protein
MAVTVSVLGGHVQRLNSERFKYWIISVRWFTPERYTSQDAEHYEF